MSAYATVEDLKTYGLPAKAITGVSVFDIEAILEAASGVVDSYIGSRFTLPVTVWGVDITKCTAEIAAYMLMKRRGFTPGSSDAEQLRIAYDDSIAWLKDVAKGLATPYGVTQSNESGSVDGSDQGVSFVVSPAQGGIGLSGSAYNEGDQPDVAVGTVTAPRLRGW